MRQVLRPLLALGAHGEAGLSVEPAPSGGSSGPALIARDRFSSVLPSTAVVRRAPSGLLAETIRKRGGLVRLRSPSLGPRQRDQLLATLMLSIIR